MGIVRLNLALLIGAAGCVALYFAFFADIPASVNSWSPTLRQTFHTSLLITSGVLFAFAAAIAVFTTKDEIEIEGNRQSRSPNTNLPIDPLHHPIVLAWWKLPTTQKHVVNLIYEHFHKDVVTLDDLYRVYHNKHGGEKLKSHDELFYRLRTIEAVGFFRLVSVAAKSTDIEKSDKVRKALKDGDVIKTGG